MSCKLQPNQYVNVANHLEKPMTETDNSDLSQSSPRPHVLQLTLNRPASANAFNTRMAHDLVKIFEDLALNAGDTRCVVLTGAGDRAFCAGADLKERNGMTTVQRMPVAVKSPVQRILFMPPKTRASHKPKPK